MPAIDVMRDTAGATSSISPAATRLSDPIADVAVDAWSVTGGTTLGAKFAGVETKLFQAGLLPYLVYLYFLGKDEARTPAASNFGARFLLLRLRHPRRHRRKDEVRRYSRQRRRLARHQREPAHREQLSLRLWVRDGPRGRGSERRRRFYRRRVR